MTLKGTVEKENNMRALLHSDATVLDESKRNHDSQ